MTAPPAAPPAALPSAVLWDMDGTLVDTEPYWMAAEHALVAEFGGVWTDSDARSVIGFDLLDTAAVLRAHGVELDPEEIVARLHAAVIARVAEEVPWRPGARRLLLELNERGVPCALVTMSWRPLADAVVAALEPLNFQAVITGDAVDNGKPHPEPYLRAAAALGVDAVDCVAIEDSPTGAASAAAAGCAVVAVPNQVAIDQGPDRVIIPSLRGVHADDLGPLVATRPTPVAAESAKPPAPGELRRRRSLVIGLGVATALIVGGAALGLFDDDLGSDGGGPAPAGPLAVHAWAPYWALDDSLPDLAEQADMLEEVSPFWFEATAADSIRVNPNTPAAEAEQFMTTATGEGIPIVGSILDATAPGEMAAILADREQRTAHVDAIVSFAGELDLAGVDIDYERFAFADGRDTWAATRPNWVAFIRELSARLHADGRRLTVSIPPVYDDGRTRNSGYWVYDYAAITPFVDHIRVMAYDYSNASTDPGPIAPLDWVRRVIAGTSSASGDPSKLLLGVPLYGYNWPTAVAGDCPADGTPGVTAVTNRSVDDLAEERGASPVHDAHAGEWSFTYDLQIDDGTTSCTQQRQVNYVDADGAQQRMQLAVDAGFAGAALFALGYEDEAVWGAVDTVGAGMASDHTTVP